MGLIARIKNTFEKDGILSGLAEMFKNDNATVRIFNPSGVDARPLDNDICFTEDSEDTEGGKDILGFIDPKNPSIAEKGEFRAYSRNTAGETESTLYIKKNGLTDLENKVEKLSVLISDLFTEIRDITTVGGPAAQSVSPASKALLTALETRFKALIG